MRTKKQEAAVTVKVKDAINAIVDPIRLNTLKVRRRKLGLSRVKLARIFEVDPASVYRHERGAMSALWDYALRGVEAEAQHRFLKSETRDFRSGLDLQTFIPDQLEAQGFRFTAAKMREDRRKHAQRNLRPKSTRRPSPDVTSQTTARQAGALSRSGVSAAVERAIARSEENRKKAVCGPPSKQGSDDKD
jgi:DNA-binding XRE family transcriptional regulator